MENKQYKGIEKLLRDVTLFSIQPVGKRKRYSLFNFTVGDLPLEDNSLIGGFIGKKISVNQIISLGNMGKAEDMANIIGMNIGKVGFSMNTKIGMNIGKASHMNASIGINTGKTEYDMRNGIGMNIGKTNYHMVNKIGMNMGKTEGIMYLGLGFDIGEARKMDNFCGINIGKTKNDMITKIGTNFGDVGRNMDALIGINIGKAENGMRNLIGINIGKAHYMESDLGINIGKAIYQDGGLVSISANSERQTSLINLDFGKDKTNQKGLINYSVPEGLSFFRNRTYLENKVNGNFGFNFLSLDEKNELHDIYLKHIVPGTKPLIYTKNYFRAEKFKEELATYVPEVVYTPKKEKPAKVSPKTPKVKREKKYIFSVYDNAKI